MKSTLIALAAVLSLSGAALAGEDATNTKPPQIKHETVTTDSIHTSSHDMSVSTKDGFASKSGIDVNPFFLPGL